jgi:hypothetical protein
MARRAVSYVLTGMGSSILFEIGERAICCPWLMLRAIRPHASELLPVAAFCCHRGSGTQKLSADIVRSLH